MKRKLLIFSALISLLLAGFQFPIFADEDPSDSSSSVPIPNSIRLDAYFFDNYDLLPYIESSGRQYINTQINAKYNLRINARISDLGLYNSGIFGSVATQKDFCINYIYNSNGYRFYFSNSSALVETDIYNFLIYDIQADKNVLTINSNTSTLNSTEFSEGLPIYIFGRNNGTSDALPATYKLYNFSIYDYDSESYVRYYYPAKSKAGGVIGLYDAVSDTFVTTSGLVPFASPINDQVLNFQISSILTAGLGWIGDILEFAVDTPIIMIFMAIGLAGAMFRWGRRLVHF